MLTTTKLAVNDTDDTNACTITVERSSVKLAVTQSGQTAEIEFDEVAWIDFIVGTFDAEMMLSRLGMRRLVSNLYDKPITEPPYKRFPPEHLV